jgi:RHS repeat-associated protein
MNKTNNHNTEYTTRSSIMRFRNLFAGFILFSMLALLTSSALCAVTKQIEEYPKLYDSETGVSYDAAMQVKDGDEVVYDFKGTIWAPNGFRGISKKYTYSTSQEDWALDSEEEFTITTPGVHKTPMGATVVVPGFIGMNNPFYLGVEMGTRTVGVDLRATIPNVKVGEDAQLCLTLIKDGVQYHRRFDIDLGAGENTALFEFDGAFYEDEDGEGEDPEYAEWGDEIHEFVSDVSGENEATADPCGNEKPIDDEDEPGPPPGCFTGFSSTNPQNTSSQSHRTALDQYGSIGLDLGFGFSPNAIHSDQPRVFGSAGSAAEAWALDAYQMIQRQQLSIGTSTIENLRWFIGDRIGAVASKLEDDHYQFGTIGYTAEFVDSTTLILNLPGKSKYVFNNLSNGWMRLAYANLPTGDTVEYEYDGSDRLQYMKYPDNTTTEFQYVSGKIDRIIKRNGNYLKFNLGTTVESVELKNSSDTLLKKEGWEYDSDSKLIKARYNYTGASLSTQVTMATCTFTTVAGASVVASASSHGILITHDTWDSQPAGSYRIVAYNGAEYATNEVQFSYFAGGYTVVKRTVAANNQVLSAATKTYNKLNMLKESETQKGKQYYFYQYDGDSSVASSLWGNIVSSTDELARVYCYEYADSDIIAETSSNPISISIYDADGSFIEKNAYIYDASAILQKAGKKDSNDDWFTYIEANYVWDTTYESYKLMQSTDALGRTVHYAYNTNGQLTHSGIGLATYVITYNTQGRVAAQTSPEGISQNSTYYNSGHISTVVIDNATTQYGFGHQGYGQNVTDVTNAKAEWTEYVYDDLGRHIRTNLYGNDLVVDAYCTVEYDAWNRRTSYTDCKGQEKKLYYNTYGLQTRKEYINSSSIVTASIVSNYSSDNLLTSVQSYCGGGCQDVIYYEYDALKRPLYRSGVGYGNISWTYNSVGRIDSMQWMKEPDKQTSAHFEYNDTRSVANLYADSSIKPIACYSFDAMYFIDVVHYENGAYWENTYDPTYGYLTSIKNYNSSDTVIAGFEYAYNLDGLVSSVTIEDGSSIAYSYDNHVRLTDEHKRDSSSNTIYRHQYWYDLMGNCTRHTHTDSISNSTTYDMTYSGLDQLTQREWTANFSTYDEIYTYDLNGNLTRKQEREFDMMEDMMITKTQWDYTWDHEDRLIEVLKQTGDFDGLINIKKVQYRYCPSCGGNRTHKIVYDWDEDQSIWMLVKWLRYETYDLNQLRVDEKYDSDQDGLDEADPFRTERVTYNSSGRIMQIIKETLYTYSTAYIASNPTITDIYYHYDRMGVVQALTGSNGTLITGQRFESNAFGSFDGDSAYSTRRITGKEYDEDIELYYFNARWYSSLTRRFISYDPVPGKGISTLYAFADNSPMNFVDPTGAFGMPRIPFGYPSPPFIGKKTPWSRGECAAVGTWYLGAKWWYYSNCRDESSRAYNEDCIKAKHDMDRVEARYPRECFPYTYDPLVIFPKENPGWFPKLPYCDSLVYALAPARIESSQGTYNAPSDQIPCDAWFILYCPAVAIGVCVAVLTPIDEAIAAAAAAAAAAQQCFPQLAHAW